MDERDYIVRAMADCRASTYAVGLASWGCNLAERIIENILLIESPNALGAPCRGRTREMLSASRRPREACAHPDFYGMRVRVERTAARNLTLQLQTGFPMI